MAVREVKLCLLGEAAVGKSSIVQRFVKDQFRPALESTIGASFMTKRVEVDGKHYAFQIWDTAGQEKYRALAPMYYRGSAAAIVVYDITREQTFRAVKEWVSELRKNAAQDIVLAIAGNKCDLEDLREVPYKDVQDYAQQKNAIFIETSALTAVNVPDLFIKIAHQLPPEDMLTSRMNTSSIKLNDTNQKRKCCGGPSRNEMGSRSGIL
ncbi:ras-related protein Rab-22A-like [Mizuhopecten yessoensis]|uniref:Ras-related protein Rab-22A n=1 Tax=Mizuhopecten yessoensis TaxID=6573 RepID=A0A210Q7H5_MIZYE|nr:ras-related protein Rab-22A-like [Mizuhopecten yessoensis]OWF44692.1 Ras-related protein Rab-22A [Mizuhopecten yessoensis]